MQEFLVREDEDMNIFKLFVDLCLVEYSEEVISDFILCFLTRQTVSKMKGATTLSNFMSMNSCLDVSRRPTLQLFLITFICILWTE